MNGLSSGKKRPSRDLHVGGLTPLSTTDYPGLLSAVVFCQRCPWRCGYCHNPHLVSAAVQGALCWEDIIAVLERRVGLVDAVVFSGGEPTLQHALQAAMREARAMGFKIGLHTSGAYPGHLETILPLLDWVGFDVKAPFEGYAEITGVPGSGKKALESAQLLIRSGISHEFRTTIHPLKTTGARIREIAAELCALGADSWVLQAFRPQACIDAHLRGCAESRLPFDGLHARIRVAIPQASFGPGHASWKSGMISLSELSASLLIS